MKKLKEYYRNVFWRSLPGRHFFILLLAVFFTFTAVGFIIDLWKGGQQTVPQLFINVIFSGLVVYGSMVNPFFLGQSVLFDSFFNFQRLIVVGLSSFVGLIFGWIFYLIFAKMTPFGIDLDDVNKSPIAVGAFLFGYEVFLGLILYGSLMIPLG